MVSTQQVGGKDDMRAIYQGWLDSSDLQKAVVASYAKNCYDSF
jgi:hypothetical protein